MLGGLQAGERIVTSGNFLIDSESKLKSASGGMGAPVRTMALTNKAQLEGYCDQQTIEFCANNRFIVLLFVSMAVFAGLYSIKNINLDAVPDLSDTQVIIYTRWDRSPDIIEDQVTYPIISNMLGVPRVKDIRGFSDFGFSYVYIIFEEGTDIYWARSERLNISITSCQNCHKE